MADKPDSPTKSQGTDSATSSVQVAGKETSANSQVRQDLVENAAKFLNNQKVQGSSLESRKAFLRKKGLSEAEINLAVAKAKEINPALGMQVAHAPPTYASAPPLPVREVQVVHKRGWKDYTLAAVIIAGVSYVIVVFIKKYILNWFWRREEELDQKMSAMRDTLEQTREELTQAVQGIKEATQTMQEMTMQQRQLLTDPSKDGGQDNRRVLEEVKSDISSIKGLILGRSQFPSTPNVGGIPAWQKTATVSPSSPFEKVEMEEEIPLATEATNNSNQAAERITGKTDD